jgi:hypothetical protein
VFGILVDLSLGRISLKGRLSVEHSLDVSFGMDQFLFLVQVLLEVLFRDFARDPVRRNLDFCGPENRV